MYVHVYNSLQFNSRVEPILYRVRFQEANFYRVGHGVGKQIECTLLEVTDKFWVVKEDMTNFVQS